MGTSQQASNCEYAKQRITTWKRIMTAEKQMDAIETAYKTEACNGVKLQKELEISQKSLKDANEELSVINLFHEVASNSYETGNVYISDGYVYYVSRFTRRWHESKHFCQMRLNASLPHSLNYTTNANLRRILQNIYSPPDYVWIGGHGHGSDWWWETSRNATERISWSDWVPNQPNNEYNPACIVMHSSYQYRWDDFQCSDYRYFVCVRPLIDDAI